MSTIRVVVHATRFVLHRHFSTGHKGICTFVMLNPSTADDVHNDPTINRCIGFAQYWGYEQLTVVNTNPCRATDPKRCPFPTRDELLENDIALMGETRRADLIVCAWGTNVHPQLDAHTRYLLRDCTLHHLGLTKHGQPRHPLYLPKSLQPQLWNR